MRLSFFAVLLAVAGCLFGCGDAQRSRPLVAYVTNGALDFWRIAAAGAKAAAAELDVEVDVRMPSGVVEQQQVIEDLLIQQVDGIALSPIDAANQLEMIDKAAAQTLVITHDADAPKSKRLCYVGMQNYDAGNLCAELVLEAIPDGGEVMLFVGRMEQDNARQRRQGLIDKLLGRSYDPSRFDPPGKPITNGKYTIVDTRTDQLDQARAKSNAEDAITAYPNLACMVGLFAYNAPACLEALRAADKLQAIKLVAFDEDEATLQGVIDGHVVGTVVQDPYQYGYQSVTLLSKLLQDQAAVPSGGLILIPARAIRQAEAAAFRDDLRVKIAAGKQ